MEGIICSAGRKGKQFTYGLLEERAPQARTLAREQALAELARRYFRSHGPATLQDYVWWSGLTTRDARSGIEAIQVGLAQETIDELTYWFVPSRATLTAPLTAHLLPDYDEYTVGYRDRRAIFNGGHASPAGLAGKLPGPVDPGQRSGGGFMEAYPPAG